MRKEPPIHTQGLLARLPARLPVPFSHIEMEKDEKVGIYLGVVCVLEKYARS